MCDLIVSVPDHCLSFYFFLMKLCNRGGLRRYFVFVLQLSIDC